MSRSRKKHPVVKDRGMTTHEYWSVIRHEWKQALKTNWEDEDLHLRLPDEIINKYNYCDWKYRAPKRKPNRSFWFRSNYTDEEWNEIYNAYLRK